LGAGIDVRERVAAKCIGGAREERKKNGEVEAEDEERREVGHREVCGVSTIPAARIYFAFSVMKYCAVC